MVTIFALRSRYATYSSCSHSFSPIIFEIFAARTHARCGKPNLQPKSTLKTNENSFRTVVVAEHGKTSNSLVGTLNPVSGSEMDGFIYRTQKFMNIFLRTRFEIKKNLFWGQLYPFLGTPTAYPFSSESKTRRCHVFTSFQDWLTNSHINGYGSARAFHWYDCWWVYLGI